MEVEETRLPGVKIITPLRIADDRGFFSESYNREKLLSHGIDIVFVQDNHSFSTSINTIRALHYQSPPHAQAKLVRCGRGLIYDVVVDVRKESPTFGEWLGIDLSFENGKQLLVPVGFLHGFVTRSQNTEIIYKCSDHFSPECDGAIRFDDPSIAIDWGIDTNTAILSAKDTSAPLLAEIDNPFVYESAN